MEEKVWGGGGAREVSVKREQQKQGGRINKKTTNAKSECLGNVRGVCDHQNNERHLVEPRLSGTDDSQASKEQGKSALQEEKLAFLKSSEGSKYGPQLKR